MLGRDLLVAPVVQACETLRTVYLPEGPQAWYDFHSGERYEAGQTHSVPAPPYTLPLFARAGAEIPIATGTAGRHRHDDPVTEVLLFGD